MNKFERFRAVIQGHPVDRVPSGFWMHFDPEFQRGEAMARRHIAYYRQTGMDILKVMNDNGYPAMGSFRVRDATDWRALEPSPDDAPAFRDQIEGLAGVMAEVGAQVPVIHTVFGPFREAVRVLWQSEPGRYPTEHAARMGLLAQLRETPEPVLRGLEVITADVVRFCEACAAQTGVHGVYFSAKGGEIADMTDAEHAAWVKPFDLRVLQAVGAVSEFVVGHFCGVGLNLGRFTDYPVHIANWAYQSDNPSLLDGKAILHGVSILGGLDERGPLVHGPREALHDEIERAVAQVGAQGFMLGAGCTVPGDTDIANLVYARELVAELTAE